MTTPTQPHSPLPWSVLTPYTDRHVYPIGYRSQPGVYSIIGEFNSCGGTEDNWAANAEFACHAVNHHHELVDKLERMVEVFNCSDPDELKAFYAVEQARGVLAKVKGGQS